RRSSALPKAGARRREVRRRDSVRAEGVANVERVAADERAGERSCDADVAVTFDPGRDVPPMDGLAERNVRRVDVAVRHDDRLDPEDGTRERVKYMNRLRRGADAPTRREHVIPARLDRFKLDAFAGRSAVERQRGLDRDEAVVGSLRAEVEE